MPKLIAKYKLREGDDKPHFQVIYKINRPIRWRVELWFEDSKGFQDTVVVTTKSPYSVEGLASEVLSEEIEKVLKSVEEEGSHVVAYGWRAFQWG